MKAIALKYLAQLSSGFTIRESLDFLDVGEVKAVQIKDLPKHSHQINTDLLTDIEWRYDSKPQYLSHNAILFVSRGEPAAYLFTGDINEKVVASNPFIIIYLNDKTILPEFMVWYLNNAITAKNYLNSVSRGSSLPITTIGALKELPVIVPPLAQQQEIIYRHLHMQKEKQHLEQLIQLRHEYNNALAEQLLMKN
ncbi:restriction endonuclease subunit S [Neisseria sp. DTU_2021_1001991_1_SI_NGA_ILE_055]|uniref:restriction endonuclease subunit S n=1 Tax=Neisseria sp. DTU_2021_1001991_1_SI_NGA_ILE_055 TaxID=3077590 RepID=UPI00288AF4AB|nr:restriction endonuclease subunit S [Neisseria sp. DTU_2021_1001991_1_SI_NGA_ILE_055]WNS84238.1 restriction endonuclease subunit S [Neisseria sp. DTU_2021_1001991_1_SI_NGA_ILE_055]